MKVKVVQAGGAASKTGQVYKGMMIVAVNGKSVEELTKQEVLARISTSHGACHFGVVGNQEEFAGFGGGTRSGDAASTPSKREAPTTLPFSIKKELFVLFHGVKTPGKHMQEGRSHTVLGRC